MENIKPITEQILYITDEGKLILSFGNESYKLVYDNSELISLEEMELAIKNDMIRKITKIDLEKMFGGINVKSNDEDLDDVYDVDIW